MSDVQELDASNFWLELPKIVKGFKWMYLFVIGMSIAMVMIAYVVPQDWRITGFYSTVPLGVMLASHALFPITVSDSISLLTVVVEPPIDDIHFLIRKAIDSGVVVFEHWTVLVVLKICINFVMPRSYIVIMITT